MVKVYLQAEDGVYVTEHPDVNAAMEYVRYQFGDHAEQYAGAWYDDYGRVITMEEAD